MPLLYFSNFASSYYVFNSHSIFFYLSDRLVFQFLLTMIPIFDAVLEPAYLREQLIVSITRNEAVIDYCYASNI